MMKLVFLFALALACVYAGSVTQVVNWDGGWCSVCDPNFYTSNYACSNNHGNWNHGKRAFADLVPTGEVVYRVEVTLEGEWDCTEDPFSIVQVSLQDTVLDTQNLYGQCECTLCDTPATYVWEDPNGLCFPNYNYRDISSCSNKLQLTVLQNTICLKQATITLYHKAGNPATCGELLPTCTEFGGCGDHGNCTVDFETAEATCECESEWYGPNCQCNVPSYHLHTDHPPVMDVDRSGFTKINGQDYTDTLTLFVNNSVKYYDTTITFKNSLNNTCDFPLAHQGVVWTTSFYEPDCVNTLVGQIPWVVAWPTCVFDRRLEPNWLVFEGEMIVNNKELVGELHHTRPIVVERTIVSRLPFIVRFPRSVNVGCVVGCNGTHVYDNVNIFASITEQIFESGVPVPPGTGHVTLLTSVQYPFRLIDGSLDGDAVKFSMSVTGVENGDCQDDGTVCNQYWSFDILPFLGECHLDGDYVFSFNLECQAGVEHGACPLTDNNDQGTIEFTLESEYFCPEIIEDIDLSGALYSYGDEDHTMHSTAFLMNENVYYVATTNSNKATIVETSLAHFELLLWNGDVLVLFDHGNTPVGDAVDFQVITSEHGDETYFQYNLNEEYFPVDVDGNEYMTCNTVVDVTYFNTDPVKRALFKRSVQSSQTMSMSIQTNIANDGTVDDSFEEAISTANQIFVGAMMVAIAAY